MNKLKRIFLVEDDDDDQLFFSDCIDKIDNVTLLGIANNGEEALDQLKNSATLPYIIFMDINMPRMSGIECLEEIKKIALLSNIPIVILSSDSEQAQLAHSVGAKAFIKKQADWGIMQTKVEQMINLDFIIDSQFANQTFETANA